MAFEVYRTQMVMSFESRRQTSTFYFLVDNSTNVHCHKVAASINQEYYIDSDWAFYFLSMISEKSWLSQINTRRIRPSGGASSGQAFSEMDVTGRWLSDPSVNFITANLKWSFNNDQTGKHQVRIGPLGEGVIQAGGFYPLWVVTARAFVTEHIAVHLLDVGLDSRGCINHQSTGGTPIEDAVLGWPPGRQQNRRWRP